MKWTYAAVLGRKLDVSRITLRFGHRLLFFAQAVEMKCNCPAHISLDFLPVRPVEIQPGKSGEYAENPVCVVSMTIKYFFISSTPFSRSEKRDELSTPL